MINGVWGLMMAGGVFYAACTGRAELVTGSALRAAGQAVNLAFGLIGVMCLWTGMLRLAERAGLIRLLALLLSPLTRRIFRGVPKDHPAMGAIVMTISANLLGLGNAATPLGIRAMQELQRLNPHRDTATPAMCTFLALCTTGFTLVPATVIALRTSAGSANPSEIIGATLLTSLAATILVLAADGLCRWGLSVWERR